MLPYLDDGSYYEVDQYPGLRELLAPEFQNASPEEIDAIVHHLYGDALSADDLEALPLAPIITGLISAAPAIISAAPGIIQGVQSLLRGTATQRPPSRPVPPVPPRPASLPPTPAPQAPTQPGSQNSAAVQLLTLLTTMLPQLIQSLGSMSMGPYGRENIRVGESLVPVEEVVSMVDSLAQRTIEEYRACRHAAQEMAMEYASSAEGIDLADQDQRADALFDSLLDEVSYLGEIEWSDYPYDEQSELGESPPFFWRY